MRELCRIRDLCVSYSKDAPPALKKLDLEIYSGERLAIIGESGSGKSTLARVLTGLLPRTSVVTGRIDWAKGRAPAAGGDIGIVFQDSSSSLNPVLTIGEQVAEGARRHLGLSAGQARAHALDMLHKVQLPQAEKVLKSFPHQLSGGQRQRVAIAAALAARPSVLVADEVTSALDMVVQAQIVALLDTLVRENGMTLIFITHDIALACSLADRMAVFKEGVLVEAGPSARLVANPQHAYTRRLIASHRDLSSPPLVEGAEHP